MDFTEILIYLIACILITAGLYIFEFYLAISKLGRLVRPHLTESTVA